MSTTTRHRAAVVVGRFQIFHKGHQTLLRTALEQADRVVMVIGSAFRSRDTRNPFTWQERAAMVKATLTPAEIDRVDFEPVRDYYDNTRWDKAVRIGVARAISDERDVILVGFKKDHTSYYLSHFPGWQPLMVQQEHDVDATALRGVFFGAPDMDSAVSVLTSTQQVDPRVIAFLSAWSYLPAYAAMKAECAAIAAYRKKYTADVYVTADAVVQVGDRVLLVQRGGKFGYDLWALPGGFVNRNEPVEAAAIRELREETGFGMLEQSIRTAKKSSDVFDDPSRSARARLITHAFHYQFGEMAEPPEVHGADDAKNAKWVRIADLPSFEDKLFEDHAVILDHFVGMFGER